LIAPTGPIAAKVPGMKQARVWANIAPSESPVANIRRESVHRCDRSHCRIAVTKWVSGFAGGGRAQYVSAPLTYASGLTTIHPSGAAFTLICVYRSST